MRFKLISTITNHSINLNNLAPINGCVICTPNLLPRAIPPRRVINDFKVSTD